MTDIIQPYTKEALTEQGWAFEETYIPDPPIHDSRYDRISVQVSRSTVSMDLAEFEKLFEAAKLGKSIGIFDELTATTMPAAYTKGGYNSENMLPEYVVITVFAPQILSNQTVYDKMFRIYAQNRIESGFTLSIREFRSKAFDEITS